LTFKPLFFDHTKPARPTIPLGPSDLERLNRPGFKVSANMNASTETGAEDDTDIHLARSLHLPGLPPGHRESGLSRCREGVDPQPLAFLIENIPSSPAISIPLEDGLSIVNNRYFCV
jgi:hypothetical protein